jgi:hypothetical protein
MESEEHESPLRHPIHAAEHEVEHLAEVAREGQSPSTPLIVVVAVSLVVLVVVVLLIGAAFLAAHYATS